MNGNNVFPINVQEAIENSDVFEAVNNVRTELNQVDQKVSQNTHDLQATRSMVQGINSNIGIIQARLQQKEDISLIRMRIKFSIPSKEAPVSFSRIPSCPPNVPIMSKIVYLDAITLISGS